ncbi:MAG: thiamine pyrophosphate-binding protein [Deltaproteobacteria bacterium]|nr:thiamine pyrophosphate-binding protein [Deltaproteobacteria bacterium]MDZ4342968.1 thiamine pyrophosphate-binding protein [Candidatus Binatia bacterium]
MARVTGSHLICKALKLEGVKNIFALAGDHILPVLDVMADQDFRIIDTRHEQAAVHMADAWSRITEQPGVCMYTTPGFANAIPGLTNASHTEAPVISIAGCADTHDLGRGAQQEIEQVAMAGPMTKGSFMVRDARRIPEFIARAMRLAFSGRRGPVHLTIPIDVQEQNVEEDQVIIHEPKEYRAGSSLLADPEKVRQAIALLHQAEKPLAVAGSAAGYTLSGDALRRFIETTRLPVVTEEQARGLISDDHPYAFGFFERGLNRAAGKIRDADVVVLLGRKQDFVIGFCRPPNVRADAKIIQIDPSPLEIGRNRGVAVGMLGDVTSVLEQMTKEAANHVWKDLPWLDELRAVRAAQAEWAEDLARPATPMHALFVHKTLKSILRPDDCIVFDGGDFCHFGRSFLPALKPKHWLYVSSLGMLGTSLPSALAAKVAYPDSRVFMLTGDGAFGFNGMEFDTAVRHKLNIVAILGNDSAWGIDRQIQLGLYGRAVATDLRQTRYDQVVQGLGGYGEFVERPEDLAPALERALGAQRPALLNVAVERAISPRAEAAIGRRKAAAQK